MSNWFGVIRGPQNFKNRLLIRVVIGGAAIKGDKKTQMLVIMCTRLLQKISLRNLMNGVNSKKETARNNVQKHFQLL